MGKEEDGDFVCLELVNQIIRYRWASKIIILEYIFIIPDFKTFSINNSNIEITQFQLGRRYCYVRVQPNGAKRVANG